MPKDRRLHTFTDRSGQSCALLPLTGTGLSATLHTADLETLEAHGVSLSWFLNDNGSGTKYVRAHDRNRRNLVMVSRVLMGATRQQIVWHRDGDRLNLRRENLALRPRGWKGPAKTPSDFIAAAESAKAEAHAFAKDTSA